MKNRFALYWTLLPVLFCFLAANRVYPQTFTWLSGADSEKYIVSIVGPIVDPDREEMTERQRRHLQALERAIDDMIKQPNRHLPESYLETIRKLQKQRWNPDVEEAEITADEEEQLNAWLMIVGDGTKENPGAVVYRGTAFDADNTEIAEILVNSYSHIEGKPSGQELAYRLNLDKSDFVNRIVIDGYRFVYDQEGRGYAEWFSLPIEVAGFDEERMQKVAASAVKNLLLLPFHYENAMVFRPSAETRIKFWKTPSLPGEIWTESEPFELEKTPITEKYYEQCRETGWCEKADDDDGFVLVSNGQEARQYCSARQKHLLRSASIPFLYLQYKEILEDKHIWVEDNARPIKVAFGDFDYTQLEEGESDEEALVWCRQQKSSFLYQFEEQQKDIILGRSFGVVRWYNPEMADREDHLFQSNENHLEILEPDSDRKTLVRGNILFEKNDKLDVGNVINYDTLEDDYSAVAVMTHGLVAQLVSKKAEIEHDFRLVKGTYISGKLYSGYTWSFGIAQLGNSFSGESKSGDKVSVKVEPGGLSPTLEVGRERPLYVISDMRWGIYLGADYIAVKQKTDSTEAARGNDSKSVSMLIPNASLRISYGLGGFVLYLGQTYTVPVSGDFGSDFYFEKIEIGGSATLTAGIAYLFD